MKKIIFLVLVFSSSYVYANCGLPPLPPLGCSGGYCLCDGDGNCTWVFNCS